VDKLGKCCPIKCASFSSERENTVLQWAFTLKNVPAAAGTWDLKVLVLKVNIY
jgi:hypothetical protein